MSIKTTLNQLIVAADAKAIAHVNELVPPGGYKFRVAKLLDAVEREIAEYRKQNNELIRKYGIAEVEKDAEGKEKPTGNITLTGAPAENVMAFMTAVQELLLIEVTIPYEPIIFAKLGTDAQDKLTINDIRALGPLLVEELPAEVTPLKSV
jgi:hypothetical protein